MSRLPFLLLGLIALVAGVLGGLLRLGWNVPVPSGHSVSLHGVLMVCGFFGTVISLERAVALQRAWLYAGPLLAGASGVAVVMGKPLASASLAVAAAALAVAGNALVVRAQPALHSLTLLLGAACWLAGNVQWVSGAGFDVVTLWWIAFLVLTIAGERLELTRLLPPSPALRAAYVAFVVMLLAAASAAAFTGAAGRVFGVGAALVAGWLAIADIARRNAREGGLTGFIATTLLGGYAWLALGGVVMAAAGGSPGSPAWDAAVHAMLLGFVFSMVFAHAPIIVPGVARVAVRWSPAFYAHVVLLHASLLLRLAGDLAGAPEIRAWGAMVNAIALLAFLLNTVVGIARGARSARPRGPGAARR